MNWREHIVTDPTVLRGKPIVTGTRISVELLMDRFAEGWNYDPVIEAYPHLARQQMQAAMSFVAKLFREELQMAVDKVPS